MRIPRHIGIIPDGNRRWAVQHGMTKDKGYDYGINPGLKLFKLCQQYGIDEVSYYGFTIDNTKRPSYQKEAFIKACVDAVNILSKEDAELLVVGNSTSPCFPKELIPFTTRRVFGKGGIRINFLVNYGWEWDLNLTPETSNSCRKFHSSDVSRIDMVVRWGGRRRLSGFLPIQSVYADFYVIDDYWPDFKKEHLDEAIRWYSEQDITLGG